MSWKDLAVEINGKKYLTVKDFAVVINRSEGTVRRLMSAGNRLRKIKFIHLAGKPFILASEVFNYPFTLSGRNTQDIFNYMEDNRGRLLITRATGYCSSETAVCDDDCLNCVYYKEILDGIQDENNAVQAPNGGVPEV